MSIIILEENNLQSCKCNNGLWGLISKGTDVSHNEGQQFPYSCRNIMPSAVVADVHMGLVLISLNVSTCVLQDHYPKLHMTQESFSSLATLHGWVCEASDSFHLHPITTCHKLPEMELPQLCSHLYSEAWCFSHSQVESDFPFVIEDNNC